MDGDTHQPGEARNIQAIDKQSVHRICSGQVILSLATAVKELVENSLDAGAKSIEIKLRDYGSELLEVIDNGCGVKEENFEGLTLKHHTSKLQDFSDLVLVDTFGFRGEALSSLCALSNMVITTCHKNTAVATRLEFNHNGKLLVKTPSARQAGTTVSLQNLFSTLPVRHKEFVRNLKKEFNKMVQVLYAYCIISTNVKISCTNQVGKGKKSVMVNTNGNSTMKENIANLFGAKQMQNLLEFVYADPTEEVLTEYRISLPTHKVFSITGFVSTCVHGHGRSSTDRQFYFINKRPCDLLKVSRVVNEVYHSYNRHQYPFVVLDISLDKESVDVNVTPDKRQIFIENEKLLLAVVKSSLMKLWEPKASVFHLNQAQRPQDQNPLVNRQRLSVGESSKSSPSLSRKENISSALASMKRSFSSAFVKREVSPTRCTKDSDNSKPNKQRKLDSFIVTPVIEKKAEKEIHSSPCDLKPSSPCKSSDTGIDVSPCSTLISDIMSTSQDTPRSLTFSEQDPISPSNTIPQFSVVFEDPLSFTENTTPSTTKYTEEMCDPVSNMNCVQKSYQSQKLCALKCEDVSTDRDHVLESEEIYSTSFGSPSLKSEQQRNEKDKVESSKLDNERSSYLTETSSNIETSCNYNNSSIYVSEGASYDGGNSETEKIHAVSEEMIDRSDTSEQSGNHMVCKSMVEENTGHQLIGDCGENTEKEILSEEGSPRYTVTVTEQDEPFHRRQKKERRVEFSMSQLKSRLNSRDKSQKSEDSSRWCRSFRAKINPSDNTAAEQELKREISKDMFLKMEILGQFNLGFIIVLLDRDLFIIDQHATDEKYNFEMLQRHTVIQSQKLIQPQNLELTAASEVILMDNLEVFHKNGFDFLINEDAPPTQRVKLVSIPVSKNWTFGKDDIDELLFMLNDSPGVHCRPSRVRMMFASRSCRKSIMIGTALDKPQMRKLVDHMSEIEQPWNCPHGRPTMRHLINLDMLPD